MTQITEAMKGREGVLVRPVSRLSEKQIETIDSVSRELLWDPGLLCYSGKARDIFKKAGAQVEDLGEKSLIRLPSDMISKALDSAPSRITLGAREPGNHLVLDASEPRVRFGSGSETNIWLDLSYENGKPVMMRLPGSISRLRDSAHLCDNLENLDFFIRNVNIQDSGVTKENKDVNKFLASLNNITKHVQAGLTDLGSLDDVLSMAEMIAGGPEVFKEAPPISFITCVIKSPLQIVEDTAEKLIEIARRQVPLVVSSCPMGGATGPFDEFGMVAQINAELLAGVVLTQLVSPGTPVLYGAVPVRTRLDNLNDMYGAPEVVHYTIDCAQMARFYGLPCYSTAGVADSATPGIQATFEKLLTLMNIPKSGAQYIHYAFGLLERTNTFSPEQAVMDDAHIGIIKRTLADSEIEENRGDEILSMMREVMKSDHKTFIYHLPLPSVEPVYVSYPLEDQDGDALYAAHCRYGEIQSRERNQLDDALKNKIIRNIPGILPAAIGEEG